MHPFIPLQLNQGGFQTRNLRTSNCNCPGRIGSGQGSIKCMSTCSLVFPGEEWECLDASSPIYVPHKDDEGYQLRVECSPGAFLPNEIPGYGTNRSKKRRIGESVYCDSTTVMQNPDNSSGAGRHELTRTPAPDGVIRVVTYNILADQYATTEKSLTELYPYLNQRYDNLSSLVLPIFTVQSQEGYWRQQIKHEEKTIDQLY